MSTKTTTVWVCDRCGGEHANPTNFERDRWGVVDWYVRGTGIYGPQGLNDADVCPDCMKSLQLWWQAPKTTPVRA